MKVFIYIVRAVAIVLGLISIPLVFIGPGLPLLVGMIVFLLTSGLLLRSINQNESMNSDRYLLYNIGVVIGGLASVFALYIGDGVSHIDTGGHSYPFLVSGIAVVIVITSSLIYLGHKVQQPAWKK